MTATSTTQDIGRAGKYPISVAGAASQVGKKVKARIERTTSAVAYGVLADAVEPERPVDPETELEELEAAGEPILAKPKAKALEAAAEPESQELTPAAESSEAGSRRGTSSEGATRQEAESPIHVEVGDEFELTIEDSLGESAGIGRAGSRRITVAGAATRVGETLPIRIDEVTARAVRASINGDAVEQPVAAEPVFEAAMPGDAAPAAGDDGEPKPKKRTRRGSRGGRGRKKKPPVAAETEDAGPTNGAEPTETADAGEGGPPRTLMRSPPRSCLRTALKSRRRRRAEALAGAGTGGRSHPQRMLRRSRSSRSRPLPVTRRVARLSAEAGARPLVFRCDEPT